MGKRNGYTEQELRPLLGLALTPGQVAAMESVKPRTVNRWIAAGKFPEFTIHPGNDNRIPVWAYLEFRKERTIHA